MYENGEIKTYSSNDVVCKSHKYFKAGAIMNKNALIYQDKLAGIATPTTRQ